MTIQRDEIDLVSPIFKMNPFPAFARARAQEPVCQVSLPGERSVWLVTRYEDADAVFKDPRFVKNRWNVLTDDERESARQSQPAPFMDAFRMINGHMLASDPPVHTRLRSLVSKAFTPAMIEQWRGRIQIIADELIDAVEAKGQMELVDDFAFPLPIIVITEMLGIPVEDRDKFRFWSNTLINSIGDILSFQENVVHFAAFATYLVELIAVRRQQPDNDLVSRLVEVEAEGEKLSERELVAMIFLLLVAGHETTVNFLSNGVLALFQYPDQMRLLQEKPDLIKTAVEELLRYDGPLLTSTHRWAREDVELHGKQIARGELVLIALLSANHDETRFVNGEGLDITRQENHHLAFGKGIHYCLGAPLARLEGQIAIATLLRRLPALRLNVDLADLTWRPGALMHALERLPVAF